MSGRLADISARIDTVHKLESVIKAMRGIAASRVQEANQHLQSVRSYAATIGTGISQVLARVPPADERPNGEGHAVVVFAAEQGFAGGFSDRVFDHVARQFDAKDTLFVVGDRGVSEAVERGWPLGWQAPMVSQPALALGLATRLTDVLFERLAAGAFGSISVVHAAPTAGGADIHVDRLVPFDFERFPAADDGDALFSLPPTVMLESLVQEYVFAQLAEAALLSFAAENEARMRAMIAAQDNTAETLAQMVATSRQLRQEEITEEILELAVSGLAQS